MCSCPVPAWWIPGALAWNVAWFFHTWSSWPHVSYLLHFFSPFQIFMPLDCLPSVFVSPRLVRAMLCAWQPACPVDCLSVVRHSAYHLSLANPLRIFFFFKDLCTLASFPKAELIIWYCEMPMKGRNESSVNRSSQPVNVLPSWNMTHLQVTKLHLGLELTRDRGKALRDSLLQSPMNSF